MSNKDFMQKCKELVHEYTNEHLDKSDHIPEITMEDVFVVWLTKVLGNNKALLSTTIPDGMYYEVTYNGERNELYFDAYKKFENRCVEL